MTISLHRRALVIVMSVATTAQAQSTSRVGEREKPMHLELSAGFDHTVSNSNFYGEPGTVLAGAVAARWAPGDWGVRATVFGTQRRSTKVTQYSALENDSVESEDRALAFTVSADASFRIWRDLTIAPSLGVGFSPYAHGQHTVTRTRTTPSTAPPGFENSSRTGSGALWMAGLALRYRHLVIEKQAIEMPGAQEVLAQGREYYPLYVGLRF